MQQLDNEEGFYTGIVNNINLIKLNLYEKADTDNWMITGKPGNGRAMSHKLAMVEAIQENYVVDNHYNNNNNWLKRHGVPMIRRGHRLYKLAKRLKKEKPIKIVFIDPEEEYVDLAQRKDINDDIIECAGDSIGQINPLQIYERVNKEFSYKNQPS